MKVRVAVVQMDCKIGDVRANLETIRRQASSLRKQRPDFVCFPELATTGYSLNKEWRKYAETVPGGATDELSSIAIENDCYLISGVDELDSETDKIYDTAVLIGSDGKITGTYRKVQLWNEERNYFSVGSDFRVFNTAFGKVGLGICYDLEFPEPARLLALKGAKMIFFPSAEMRPFENHVETYLKSRAAENCAFVAFSNRIGTEGKTIFFGRSQIISPELKVLAMAGRDNTAVAELDLSLLDKAKLRFPYLEHRVPEAYSGLVLKAKAFFAQTTN